MHSRVEPSSGGPLGELGREPPLWRLVGRTPLLPLPLRVVTGGPAQLFVKAEWMNPGGSVKDRAAREILRAGIATGELLGRRLLDSSSGNTAVSYAMLGAAADIEVTVCVPANASLERRRLLRIYGAEVIETSPLESSDGAIRRARELARERPDRYWYADQYSNPANPQAHYRTTGPEIWRATNGRVTHLVAGVGTGGTLMGIGRFLRKKNPEVRLIAVQPDGPLHGLEGLKHLDTALVPAVYDASLVDETIRVSTEQAEAKVRALAREAGWFVGWSAGAAIVAAETVAAALEPERSDAVIVVIAPDAGTRYLSERGRLGDL